MSAGQCRRPTRADPAPTAEGMTIPTRAEAKTHGPVRTLADGIRAAEAEEAAILAWRNQPETEGGYTGLEEAGLGGHEAGS